MRLISLVTKNFKKLGSTTINFTSGLNVLAGDNARGKSSALQAIKCALFGVSMVPGKKEHIPTWGQTKFEVTLHFAIGAEQYVVVRTGTTAKLTRMTHQDLPDDLVANGTTPVSLEVEKLLGLSSKDYGLFIESEQGSSTGVLTFGATALNRKVEEFAGVDLIDKVQAMANQKAAKLSALGEASRVSQEDMDEARVKVTQASEAASQARNAALAAQAAVEAHPALLAMKETRDPEQMRNEQRTAERLLAKLEAAEAEVARCHSALEAAEQSLEGKKLINLDDLNSEIALVTAEGKRYAEKVADIKAFDANLSRLEQRVEDARITAYNAYKEAYSVVFDAEAYKLLTEQLIMATEANNQAAAAAVSQHQKVRDLKSLVAGAACPTCGHAKEDHNPEQLAEELKEAQALSADLDAQFEAAKAAMHQVSKQAQAMALLEERANSLAERAKKSSDLRDQLQAEFDKADSTNPYSKTDLGQAEANVEDMRSQYAALNEKAKQVKELNEAFESATKTRKARHEELTTALKMAEQLGNEYDALPEPPTDELIAEVTAAHKAHQVALAEWTTADRELRYAASAAKQSSEHSASTLANATEGLDRLVSLNKLADGNEALAKKYSRLVQFLRERRQQYLKEVWDTIMGVSSKLVREASNGLVSSVSNQDGEFFFVEEGIEAPTLSASGAQKSFIGTALRVGLSRALYGSDGLLIFDEPTEACSEHNAAGMAAMLASSAKQVLLITHRENDQALAENIINIGE